MKTKYYTEGDTEEEVVLDFFFKLTMLLNNVERTSGRLLKLKLRLIKFAMRLAYKDISALHFERKV